MPESGLSAISEIGAKSCLSANDPIADVRSTCPARKFDELRSIPVKAQTIAYPELIVRDAPTLCIGANRPVQSVADPFKAKPNVMRPLPRILCRQRHCGSRSQKISAYLDLRQLTLAVSGPQTNRRVGW